MNKKNNLLLGLFVGILLLCSVVVLARAVVPFHKDPAYTSTGHFDKQTGSFGNAIFEKETLKVQETSSLSINEIKSLVDDSIDKIYEFACSSADNNAQIYRSEEVILQRLDLVKDLDGQVLINSDGKEFSKSTINKDPVLENEKFDEIFVMSGPACHNCTLSPTSDYKFSAGLTYRCDVTGNSPYKFKAKIKREDIYTCKNRGTQQEIFKYTLSSQTILVTDKQQIPCAVATEGGVIPTFNGDR